MPRLPPTPPLAKLSRPKIHRAAKRERLFERMEHSTQGAVTWLVSPPGAGKTTLLATYLDSRKLPGIWYQVDRDDGEPATFFYYMSEAEKRMRAGVRRRPLPLLTPEYLQDLDGFSRRYFRELFTRLGSGAVLVLDNFQDAPEDSSLIALLMQGLLEIPEDVRVLIASRTPPPPGASRLLANGVLSVIDWDEMKLTPGESAQIALAQMNIDSNQLDGLHEKSGGWAAGLVLLIERLRRGETLEQLSRTEALQGVFAYFAEEMFQRNSDEDQRALLQLAYMPRFTGHEAVRLTGNESSLQMLERLYRRRLFLDRREGADVIYQFHALLRAFLRHQAGVSMSTSVRAGVARRAAQLLEASGQVEEAMRLYLEIQDHAAAHTLILQHAQALIAQGRWQVVVDWVAGLPFAAVEQDRWLLYWRGFARLAVDPVSARTDLERAYDRGRDAADEVCELLAAAGMVHAHVLEYVAYRPLDRWISVLQKVLESTPVFPSLEAELNVQSALLVALAYRNPSHPEIHKVAERLFELVGTGADVGARVSAALYLTLYGGVSGPSAVSERAAPILRLLLERPDVSALARGFGWFVLSYYYKLASKGAECDHALDQIRSVANDYGLSFVHRFAAIIGAWQHLGRADYAPATVQIERLQEVVEPTNLYDIASVYWLRAHSAIMQANADEALVEARKAVDIFDAAGSHFHRVTARGILIWAHVHRGEFDEARQWIADGRQIAGHVFHNFTARVYHAAEAWMALDEGDENDVIGGLQGFFGPATQHYDLFMYRLWRSVVPRLGAAALERGIETQAVRRAIQHLNCRAPHRSLEEWPWRVRVYTLGRFKVSLDETPAVFGAKVPRKPLSLLKALICMGGSSRDYHLIDALWPNEEADAARSAFGVALFRLRALLGDQDVVETSGGVIRLNRDLVWVDALAFDEMTQSADSDSVTRALDLYRGSLLPEDGGESWSLSLRERLRGKYSYHLGRLGRACEQAGDWAGASALHLRGIDVEPHTESFYIGMMRCHAAQGQSAEVLGMFRRLSGMLEANTGGKPSGEAQALVRDLVQTK